MLPPWVKVVEEALPTWTKWKDPLMDVSMVGKKVGLEPILLSKSKTIVKEHISNYITKRQGDKFEWCSKCKILKHLRDAHKIGTKSYVAHQLNYFNHVHMQEAHYNDYYAN